MKSKNKSLLTTLLALFLIIMVVNSQKRVVHGKITTFSSHALNNVQIAIKKSKIFVLSDSLGMYSISCDEKDKLIFKADGFKTKFIKVAKYTDSIHVNLEFGGSNQDLEIAIGSGYISKRNLTLAIDQFEANKLSKSSYSNVIDMIKGNIPSVRIVNREIRIRANRSMNGSEAALIVVNDFVTDFSYLESIAPSEVKSISVLKGSAAQSYGSRGANGVLIITLN